MGSPNTKLSLGLAALITIASVVFKAADSSATDEDRLWRHRNLGKAFYEASENSRRSVEEFRKALELAPESPRERLNYGLALLRAGQSAEGIAELEKVQRQAPEIPHTWFVLGLQYKRAGDYEEAIRQFEQMARLVPGDALTRFQLGLLYGQTKQIEKALAELKEATRLDPSLAGPHYQMFNIYRDTGRREEAERAVKEFLRIKKLRPESEGSEDLTASYYSEILEETDPKPVLSQADVAQLKFHDRRLEGAADPRSAGLMALDSDGDTRPDLLLWSGRGITLYRGGVEPVDAGLSALKDIMHVAADDFDNDGLPDLCILSNGGPALYRNQNGKYVAVKAPLPKGRFHQAVWLDYDHDQDSDLILLGERSFLIRNQGEGGWEDRTADFPFVPGRARAGTSIRVIADGKAIDLAVAYEDRESVLYRDRLLGVYEPSLLPGPEKETSRIVAADTDNDGAVDLAAGGPSGVTILLNRRGTFQRVSGGPAGAGGFALANLDRRPVLDLVADGRVFRNQGLGRFSPDPETSGLGSGSQWEAADFDGDGRMDLAAVATDGTVHLYTNQTATQNAWLGITLAGVKAAQLAVGAEVEVKAGSSYQKQVYRGVPLLFGLPGRKTADTIRITWPNAMIQNETVQPLNRFVTYKEAPRLSGSCPMIFTWNGRNFEFITDVLGVAPLGAMSGSGEFFPVDHDEYVWIEGASLRPAGGKYEVRITEELSEVSYLDRVALIAVDHPRNVEIFTNDKWKGPPFPDFRLFGVKKRAYPLSATDEQGRNLLSSVLRRDRVYADGFRRDYAGVADEHVLELDFGRAASGGQAVLVLNGWVDWADGSTFRRAAQQNKAGLFPPYLQVKDAAGNWRTVVEDMGMPSGKTKTIAVDLSGRFLSNSRKLRIVTNMCVYWDEIFLSEDSRTPEVKLTHAGTDSANLRFRGFSRPVIHPERKQPEYFEYGHVMPVSNWDQTPGLYTRYGDVIELLADPDDRTVIMGSGDELRLSFGATRLPPLPNDWRRDFLLLVDGWAKDRDANTAFSQNVEPLPFRGMSSYPYPASESYPADPEHEAYRREYLTRPALRLLQPLLSRQLSRDRLRR